MQCNRTTCTMTTSNRFMLYELVSYYMLRPLNHAYVAHT